MTAPNLLIIDVESFYDTKCKPMYSLRRQKYSLIEYVRDPRSMIMAAGVWRWALTGADNDIDVGYSDWCHDRPGDGTLRDRLLALDYESSIAIFHNAYFDVAMIEYHTGLLPKQVFCTYLAAYYIFGKADKRAQYKNLDGGENSLESIGQYVLQQGKRGAGDPLKKQDGKLELYGTDNFADYMSYMKQDIHLTGRLASLFVNRIPHLQKFMMDWAVRQFADPKLVLDTEKCLELFEAEEHRIDTLCMDTGVEKSVYASSDKFAKLLESMGVVVPYKESPTVKGKMLPALAQSDEGMAILKAENKHNPAVMELLQARQAVASNQLLTRAKRYHEVALTGTSWPVHVIPSGAHTNRITGSGGGGGSPLNLGKKSGLRAAIKPPPGYIILEFDYVGFELRLARWVANDLAGQTMILSGHDVYVTTFSQAAGVPQDQVDNTLRQAGKILVLSCQYGVGHKTMHASLTSNPKVEREFTVLECSRLVNSFRQRLHPRVSQTWQELDRFILWMQEQQNKFPGKEYSYAQRLPNLNLPDATTVSAHGFVWPSGRHMEYNNLFYMDDGGKAEGLKDMYDGWYYRARHGKSEPSKVYGGLMFENIAQSLAAEIMDGAQQRIEDELGHDVALQVYDSNAMVIKKPDTLEQLKQIARDVERIAIDLPWWTNGPPLAVDFKYGDNYGDLTELPLD